MKHKDADKIAQRIADADKVITEFKYRQALTLTKFETLCSKKEAKQRDEIVLALEYDADEMCEHGYFSHYRQRAKSALQTTLKLSDRESEELLMTYYFSLPREREKFKRHIIAGVVEKRPELYTLKPNPEFKRTSTKELGRKLVGLQADLRHTKELNIGIQLSSRPAEKIEKIKAVLLLAIKESDEFGIDTAVQNLTNRILPHYFKEASPYIKKDNKKALSESLRARPEKYVKVKNLLNVYGWLLLTNSRLDQPFIINALNYREQQKSFIRVAKKMERCCCGYCYC
jgi:hypothetical protein